MYTYIYIFINHVYFGKWTFAPKNNHRVARFHCTPRSDIFSGPHLLSQIPGIHIHCRTYIPVHTHKHTLHPFSRKTHKNCVFQYYFSPPSVTSCYHTHSEQDSWISCVYVLMYIYVTYAYINSHICTFAFSHTPVCAQSKTRGRVHGSWVELVTFLTRYEMCVYVCVWVFVCVCAWLWSWICTCDGVFVQCVFMCVSCFWMFVCACARIDGSQSIPGLFVCGLFPFLSLWANPRLSHIGLQDPVADRIALDCRWLSPEHTFVEEWNEIWDSYHEYAASKFV